MKRFDIQPWLTAALEAVVIFALGGLAAEWLHPGLVTDVVPWSLVAATCLLLLVGLAWRQRHARPVHVGVARAIVVVLAVAVATGSYWYFAPIPRFQPILAAMAALVVIAGAAAWHQRVD